MSLARIYTTKRAQKEWECGKCGDTIRKGESVHHFTVGYRGYKQHRCAKPGCFPKPSERESSMIADVYAAQENFDPETCHSLDDLNNAVEEVADATNEVADEYEGNEMFEINPDLQERVDLLRSAADELANWADSLEEEPVEEGWAFTNPTFEDAHDEWLDDARQAASDAINEMELP